MKNRKLTLVLVLLLVVSVLTGCGGDKPAPDAKPITTEAPTTEAPTTEAPTTEAPATEAPTTEAPTTEPPATEPLPDNGLALGVVEGNTYTNTYAGIGCDLDSSWVIYPADQLQELPDIANEMFEGTEFEAAMANVTQFTDMMAENVEQLTSVNVLLQKLDISQRIAYARLNEQEVLEATLLQKDAMLQAYANAGINVESMEIVTVTFLGREHYAMKTVAEMNGVPYYCLQTFDFWRGEYSVTITFASFVDDKTESLLDLFYPVD